MYYFLLIDNYRDVTAIFRYLNPIPPTIAEVQSSYILRRPLKLIKSLTYFGDFFNLSGLLKKSEL